MPSVRYYNQTAPFWDWVAGFEDQATRAAEAGHESGNPEDNQFNPCASGGNQFNPFAPRGWMGGFQPGMAFPHRGRHPHPPPPFPGQEQAPEAGPSAPPYQDAPSDEKESPEEDATPDVPQPRRRSHHGPRGGHHHHHHPNPRRGGPWGPRGGHHARHHNRGASSFGPTNPDSNNVFAEFLSPFGDFFSPFTPPINPTNPNTSKDFVPDIDVFDTPDAFIIHASLPGAKKDDINVTWDAEKSELGIAGVVTRPGDEEFLKTLALDERQVGVFERKVRLGSRANPAQVDADGIAARVEEGILRVSVPKLDAGYVEIKTVDVE